MKFCAMTQSNLFQFVFSSMFRLQPNEQLVVFKNALNISRRRQNLNAVREPRNQAIACILDSVIVSMKTSTTKCIF